MFNTRVKIKQLLASEETGQQVTVMGWIRTFRNNQFIALNDGSTNNNLQVVVELGLLDDVTLKRLTTGASIKVTGEVVASLGKGQKVEVKATTLEVLGDCDAEKYPLQPKKHSLEFLREKAHLRFRTNTFGSVFRLRHALAFAVHQFFNEKGFVYLNTPIITSSDAEGAGEMFRVTTLDINNIPFKSEKFDVIAEEYYNLLIEKITDANGMSLVEEIESLLKTLNLQYKFKDFIKCSYSEIQELAKRSNELKSLNRAIILLHLKIKDTGFFEKNGKEILGLPSSVVQRINQNFNWKRANRENKIKSHPYLSLCFYNYSLVIKEIRNSNDRIPDTSADFFGKSTNLTVSGQLEGELGAMAFSEIYTFGPTFRAENSNTTRHLAEFWMIEPEMAFNDIEDNMNLAEEFIQYLIRYAMKHNMEDLEFLDARLAEEEKSKPVAERNEFGLIEKLKMVVDNKFERITYTEAIRILLDSPAYKKKKFKYDVGWGIDMQSEHERYLVEKHFKKPVIVTGYPAAIKAFYMRLNDNCEEGRQTVAAMDILAPGIGEIVGGSQREERLDKLEKRMTEMHIPLEEMSWYLDTRRFGSVPHAGFGLGFERMVLFVTGMTNIRDVIAFARTPKNCEF